MASGYGTPVTIGKKRYNVRYTINALAELEDSMDAGIQQILDKDRAGFQVIRNMVWAGLLHENPALTSEAVGDLLEGHLNDGGDLNTVFGACQTALVNSAAAKSVGIKEVEEEVEGGADPLAASESG